MATEMEREKGTENRMRTMCLSNAMDIKRKLNVRRPESSLSARVPPLTRKKHADYKGPLISARHPKTAITLGSAFMITNVDRMYSVQQSIGHTVHKSLRGTSLCSTSKRFQCVSRTPDAVGPGTYSPSDVAPKTATAVNVANQKARLEHWKIVDDNRSMNLREEWKNTSEKTSSEKYSFSKANKHTWIESIALRNQITARNDVHSLPCVLTGKKCPR